jgi:hypothetical protein
MRKSIALMACGLLVGCDYTVPLEKTPPLNTDPALIGAWQQAKADGATARLVVLPLNAREYLVVFPAGSKDALFARAGLCPVAGRTLVQLEWLGDSHGKQVEDGRAFQFAEYTVNGTGLTVRMLNSAVVSKHVKTSAALAAAIATNTANPQLFKAAEVFSKP